MTRIREEEDCTAYLEVAWNGVAVLSAPKNLYQLGIGNGNLAVHA